MAQKYVFASGKGGVGKSTVALGVAKALSKRGFKVLLADFDIGLRSLDIMLGVSETVVFDWGDLILDRCSFDDAVVRVGSLSFFAAPIEWDDAFTEEKVSEMFLSMEDQYDFMFFDAPAGLGKGFSLAASPADGAILITTPDTICVRSCATAADRLRDKMSLQLVINRFEEKPIIKGKLLNLDDCIDSVHVRLFGVVPEDEDIITSSVTGKMPSSLSPSTGAFDRIARRMLGEKLLLFKDN